MEENNITTVSIPKVLAEKIKQRCEGTGFNSVSSYVTYVLRQVLSNISQEESKSNEGSSLASTVDNKPKEAFSEEDERKVKERLKSLGYLD